MEGRIMPETEELTERRKKELARSVLLKALMGEPKDNMDCEGAGHEFLVDRRKPVGNKYVDLVWPDRRRRDEVDGNDIDLE